MKDTVTEHLQSVEGKLVILRREDGGPTSDIETQLSCPRKSYW